MSYLCENMFNSRLKSRIQSHLQRLLRYVRHHPYGVAALLILTLVWLCCLPHPLFRSNYSVVLEDRQGQLLGARIAADGQWRFPYDKPVPDKYAQCVVAFEDKRFWYHPGVDPIGLGRAFWQNLRSGRMVSGGSTLTMQVIRMARGNPPRTLWEKCIEAFMATRLELTHSKKNILLHYAAHAPFGGNTVGLEAAAWRYYGKQPESLTWAEAATLAVLPNSPALIHLSRQREALLAKRNRLLNRLHQRGVLDAETLALAQAEPLPDAPLPLPNRAPHLLARLHAQYPEQTRFRTALMSELQQQVQDILVRRQAIYRANEVHNAAAVVIEVTTGAVVAYVGNVPGVGKEHGEWVDMLTAARSTGSILKPYLYALSLESGHVLPKALLEDMPTQLGDYRPENFLYAYDGAVQARRALIRSLNVPFVLLLQDYGLEKFHYNLRRLGLSTIQKPATHYGLSLILGGAEANLLELTNVYACMARRLGQFYARNGRYDPHDFRPPSLTELPPAHRTNLTKEADILSAGAIWFTFEAMQQVERPNSVGEWELFQAGRPIAWKTGTSHGFRDAWAAGVTPRYAVGVWVGNADGEGRPGLLGVSAAAPVLFDIFGYLPNDGAWFDPPYDDMNQVPTCRQSGWRAGPVCVADTTWIPHTGLQADVCHFCQILHTDVAGQWQLHTGCAAATELVERTWFVLPPVQEFYFKSKNPEYQSPPPFRPDCLASVTQEAPMQLIYPRSPTRIYLPVELDGQLGKVVFQVAHRSPSAEIYWHLDGQYVGITRDFHQLALQPTPGQHLLSLVDKQGNRIEQRFEVVLAGK